MLGVLQNQSISYVFMHMKTQKKTQKFIQLPLPGVHCRFTSSRSSLRRLSLRLTVSTRFWIDNSTKKFKIINNTLLHSQGEMSGTKYYCQINGSIILPFVLYVLLNQRKNLMLDQESLGT